MCAYPGGRFTEKAWVEHQRFFQVHVSGTFVYQSTQNLTLINVRLMKNLDSMQNLILEGFEKVDF